MGGFQTKAPARPLSVLSDTLAETNERKQMLSTATALIEAVGDSIMEDEIMDFARFITHTRNESDLDEFAKAMYMYSGMLASNVADKVVKILLNETELTELMATIDEMDSIRNAVLGENKNGK